MSVNALLEYIVDKIGPEKVLAIMNDIMEKRASKITCHECCKQSFKEHFWER